MLKDLSHVGEYAKLSNSSFRLMKKLLPGAYTFILEGSKDIPNRLLNGKSKTIGIRVSNNLIVQSILADLIEPMMSVSLIIKGSLLCISFISSEASLVIMQNLLS